MIVSFLAKMKLCSQVGPPIPVYRYTEYRDTAVNVGGIDTGIVLSNTGVFGIGNSGSQQCQSCLCLASVGAAAVQRTSRLPCIITVGCSQSRTAAVCRSASIPTGVKDAYCVGGRGMQLQRRPTNRLGKGH